MTAVIDNLPFLLEGFRTTLALVLISSVIALTFGWGSDGENWPRVIVVLNGFFAVLWLASAWMFRKAASSGSRE